MNKVFSLIISLLILTACDTIIMPTEGCDEDELPNQSESDCRNSSHSWGDPVLYVCTTDLPIAEVDGLGEFVVGEFRLINYRTTWSQLERICVNNIGSRSLSQIHALTFDVVNWTLEPVILAGPLPDGEKVCVDLPVAIDAGGQATVVVSMWGGNPTPGDTFHFEITNAEDITLNVDVGGQVEGAFPIQNDVVTILGGD